VKKPLSIKDLNRKVVFVILRFFWLPTNFQSGYLKGDSGS